MSRSNTLLKGLNNLEYVKDYIVIENYSSPFSLEGLNKLHIVGWFLIRANSYLKSMKGLESLVHVQEGLDIYWNGKLLTLEGLESLREVGSLYIENNHKLRSLKGLDNLLTINKVLSINQNDIISTTKGMSKLEHVGLIDIFMRNQMKIKKLSIGTKGSDLGHPGVKVRKLNRAKYLTIDEVQKAFSLICETINIANEETFKCNGEEFYEYDRYDEY